MIKFCITNVIYGKEYLETFLYTLPSQLTNLKYLKKFNYSVVYRIFTTISEKSIILKSPFFTELSLLAHIEFIDMKPFFRKIPHFTMSACHNNSIEYANKTNAVMIFLAPDIILSNNVFEKICASLSNGKRLLMGAALRLNKEGFIKANNSSDLINIKPRSLVKRALPHLHQLTYDTFWDFSPSIYCWPAILGWQLDEGNLLIRGFHLHPIFVWPENKKIFSKGSIDYDFVNYSCPHKKTWEVLENSDEAVLFELTTKKRINQGQYYKNKLRTVFNFVQEHLLPCHVHFSSAKIYLLTTDIRNSTTWQKKEKQSDKIIQFVTKYYNSFVFRKIRLPLENKLNRLKHIYYQYYLPRKTKYKNKFLKYFLFLKRRQP